MIENRCQKRGNRTEITNACQGNVFPVDSKPLIRYMSVNSIAYETDRSRILHCLPPSDFASIRGFSSKGLKTPSSERTESRDRQAIQREELMPEIENVFRAHTLDLRQHLSE